MSRSTPKFLIIVADDFGYSAERNDGIIQCFKHKAISAVSVMTNGHSVENAVKQAAAVKMPIDLHLNLTEGTTVSRKECSSLTGEDGFMLGKMGFRQAVQDGTVDLMEVKQEIQAQIDRYKELTGRLPVKVDGHQHVHVIQGKQAFYLIDESQCTGDGAEGIVSMANHYFKFCGTGEKHAQIHLDRTKHKKMWLFGMQYREH